MDDPSLQGPMAEAGRPRLRGRVGPGDRRRRAGRPRQRLDERGGPGRRERHPHRARARTSRTTACSTARPSTGPTLAEDVTVGHSVTLHGCTDRLPVPDRHRGDRPERGGGRGGVDRGRGGARPGGDEGAAPKPRHGHAGQGAPRGDGGGAGGPAPARRELRRLQGDLPRRDRRRLRPPRKAALDPRRHGDTRHPARRRCPPGTASKRRPGRSSPATAIARSAPPSSRRRSSSPGASGPRPTSSRRRCTPSTTATARRLTLRPEATAGIVRAVIEHNLMNTDPALKVYALGPMFRRERPQKGRYRQFHQVDVEAFGFASPTIDVEVVEMALDYLDACGVAGHELVLNSVGDAGLPPRLRGDAADGAPREPLEARRGQPAPDRDEPAARARLEGPRGAGADRRAAEDQRPPVRRRAASTSPRCAASSSSSAFRYRLDHRLVRGLDYYVRTTFEVTSGELGAQNSVLGGGRYDGLVKDLGGPDLAGIGFALGMERLVLVLPAVEGEPPLRRVPGCRWRASAFDQALLLQHALRRERRPRAPRPGGPQLQVADEAGRQARAPASWRSWATTRWRRASGRVRDMAGSTQEDVAEGTRPRPPQGEDPWLRPWATSSARTTAASLTRGPRRPDRHPDGLGGHAPRPRGRRVRRPARPRGDLPGGGAARGFEGRPRRGRPRAQRVRAGGGGRGGGALAPRP